MKRYDFLLLNARSLKAPGKKEEIELLLNSYSEVPFVFITETWLSDDDSNVLLPNFEKYNILRCQREGRRGGGVCCMLPRIFEYHLQSKLSCKEFEVIWLQIFPKGTPITIALFYRPPTDYPSMPELLLENIKRNLPKNSPTIIIGDFNYPHIDWDNLIACDLKSRIFLDFCNSQGFSQKVLFPTREQNTLDLVLTTDHSVVQSIAEGPKVESCDHSTVHGIIVFEKFKKKKIFLRNYHKGDFYLVDRQIALIDWYSLLGKLNSVEAVWQCLLEVLQNLINTYFPLQVFNQIKQNNTLPKIKRLRNKVSRLYKRVKQGDITLVNRYKESSAELQREFRNEKITRETQILTSGDIKKFWKHVKSKLTFKSQMPCILSPSGSIIYEAKTKADIINEYFCSVYTKDDGSLPVGQLTDTVDYIEEVSFPPFLVYSKLSKLPNKLSCGPDTIPCLLFKKLALSLAEPLSIVFSNSFDHGVLPSHWLKANVIPIYKNKGSDNLPSNYRPISLTCTACKVMEQIIYDAIYEHVKCKISKSQHGFLSGKSTVTQLLETLNDWTSALDQGKVVDVVYIDVAKAFDTVSHPKLLHKLHTYGISGKLLGWLKAFLSNRSQNVVVDSVQSHPGDVISGIPQGSVLGPLMFLIFINDIPHVFRSSNVKLFADDCKIYMAYSRTHGTQSKIEFQADINRLCAWTASNQLKIAFEKCSVIHLGYQNPKHVYYFGNQPIKSVECVRDLGVLVSKDLKFREHINQSIKSASIVANLIFRCFSCKKSEFLTHMFNTFVRPKLEYASSVWNPSYRRDIDNIEKVQRRFTKRIPGLRNLSYSERLKKLKIIPLEMRRLHLDLILTFKLLHSKLNVPYNTFFTLADKSCTRGHPWKLYPKRFKRDVRKNFFSHRIINIWNSLPPRFLLTNRVSTFKENLKSEEAITMLWPFLKGRGLDGHN